MKYIRVMQYVTR